MYLSLTVTRAQMCAGGVGTTPTRSFPRSGPTTDCQRGQPTPRAYVMGAWPSRLASRPYGNAPFPPIGAGPSVLFLICSPNTEDGPRIPLAGPLRPMASRSAKSPTFFGTASAHQSGAGWKLHPPPSSSHGTCAIPRTSLIRPCCVLPTTTAPKPSRLALRSSAVSRSPNSAPRPDPARPATVSWAS